MPTIAHLAHTVGILKIKLYKITSNNTNFTVISFWHPKASSRKVKYNLVTESWVYPILVFCFGMR